MKRSNIFKEPWTFFAIYSPMILLLILLFLGPLDVLFYLFPSLTKDNTSGAGSWIFLVFIWLVAIAFLTVFTITKCAWYFRNNSKLYDKLPEKNGKYFLFVRFAILLLIPIQVLYLFALISKYFSIGFDEPLGYKMLSLKYLFFPLYFITGSFLAKNLNKLERKTDIPFTDKYFLRDLFLFCFLIIGIWVLPKRIQNAIAMEE